jgi:predicted acyltransferase (DUF342 family)
MRNKSGLMRDEKGQVLIWVIALMVLAALIIPPFVASAYSGLHTSSVQQEKMQEFYAADTGIEDALQWIISEGNNITITKPGDLTLPAGNSTPESPAEPALYTLSDPVNNCTVVVEVQRDESYPLGNYTYFVYATATNQDNGGHVKVRVHVSPTGNWTTWSKQEGPPHQIGQEGSSNNPFSYAMGSLHYSSEVDLKQSDVTGDVYVNGPLNLIGGKNIVNGSVYSVGDLTLNEGSMVTGNVSVTGNLLLEETSIIGENAWGNKSITVNTRNFIGGDAYAQTDINVASGSIHGTAWANNNINVTGTINQSAYSNNDINGTGAIEGWAYYLYTLQPSVHVGNSAKLTVPVIVEQPLMPQIGPPPTNPQGVYLGNATGPGSTQINGDVTIKNNESKSYGPCLINGNLDVKGTLTITGTVYVMGTITLENSAVVTTGNTNPPNDTPKVLVGVGAVSIYGNVVAQVDQAMPLIMSVNSNITCWNNSVINAALYAPNGIVWVHNGAKVYGAIVAQQITNIKDTGSNAQKQSTIVYNEAVKNIPGLPYATIEEPGGSQTEPTEQDVPNTQPFGVHVDSYIVLEG